MPSPLMEELVERDLEQVRQQLRQMTRLVVKSLADATQALKVRDRKLAYAVILADNRIDQIEGQVDRLCQEFLVRHMPVAAQLRFIVGAIKVNSELERIGDYADAIARRTVSLAAVQDLPIPNALFDLGDLVVGMLERAMSAFLEGDPERADGVQEDEKRADDLNRQMYHDLARVSRGEKDLSVRFALLGVLNRLERVADRACNIAEDAIYSARGEVLRHAPRHGFKVLFISPADATLGPMAEAIGRRHAPLHVSFNSAGLKPGPLDARMVEFLARRGIEVTRPRPRGIADVGPIKDYYVVVTLSREVEDACPPLPYGAVQLFWDVPDPSRIEGPPAEVEAAYAAVYEELDAKVTDLIGAIVGAAPPPEKNR